MLAEKHDIITDTDKKEKAVIMNNFFIDITTQT